MRLCTCSSAQHESVSDKGLCPRWMWLYRWVCPQPICSSFEVSSVLCVVIFFSSIHLVFPNLTSLSFRVKVIRYLCIPQTTAPRNYNHNHSTRVFHIDIFILHSYFFLSSFQTLDRDLLSFTTFTMKTAVFALLAAAGVEQVAATVRHLPAYPQSSSVSCIRT